MTIKELIRDLPSWDLSLRQQWDLQLLMNGAFAPLEGFLTKKDYESVLEDMRLENGKLWPIPITLDVTEEFAETIKDKIVLRDAEGVPWAILTITDKWKPDRKKEAEKVFGTTDEVHPGVEYLLHQTNPVYLGGTIEQVDKPSHHTFNDIRQGPNEVRKIFKEKGWDKVVAFQTRNPLHKAHFELTVRAMEETGAKLFLHPVVGRTKDGDIDYYTRVKCYKALMKYYPEGEAMLNLLPLAMRMGGPREALWHAIIRKNYGCTHFIVGRNHADPGKNSKGEDFYGPYDAQELVKKHAKEIGIEIVSFENMVYVENKNKYMPISQVSKDEKILNLSGTELRSRLRQGKEIPDWFSFPEVLEELRKEYPPPNKQGFTVFFSGLPSCGKSTVAKALEAKLMEEGSRPVTLLDGDIVRTHISNELGFSKEHRDINIRRIGFVASEITKNRGVAICAPIGPYDKTRKDVRKMINEYGGFILVHISTPLEVCEKRDRKGLYAKARKGLIKEFTGIDDPYEEPKDAEIVIDTSKNMPEEAANKVYDYLKKQGYVS